MPRPANQTLSKPKRGRGFHAATVVQRSLHPHLVHQLRIHNSRFYGYQKPRPDWQARMPALLSECLLTNSP